MPHMTTTDPVDPDPSVPLVARRYTHPGVVGAVVVRLVPEPVGQVADELAGAVGLELTRTTAVGTTTLGPVRFPASVVLHDPAHARAALAIAGEMREITDLARSKPSKARARVTVLTDSLAQRDPALIPYVLEEVGRLFIEQGNRPWAGQMLAKAREAEETHALSVDEARHHAVMMEFARAGAVTNKAMSAEARSLAQGSDPVRALEAFTALNMERVRSGILPYPALPDDLRPLARAAGAEAADIETRLCAQALATCSLEEAPVAFWERYLVPLAAAARDHEPARRLLYGLQTKAVPTDEWVHFLTDAGVIEDMRAGRLSARDWVSFYLAHRHGSRSYYPRYLAEVVRTLPGLEGLRLRLQGCHAELADALLAAGVELSIDGSSRDALHMWTWAEQKERRPLDHLATSHLAPRAVEGLTLVARKRPEALMEHESTRNLLAHWVGETFSEHRGLLELGWELERLEPLMVPEVIPAIGEPLEALLDQIDGPQVLAAALRAGLRTELTWPALEEAVAELRATYGVEAPLTFHESWPAVGVACNGEVIWVDGARRLATATFAPVLGANAAAARFVLVGESVACFYKTPAGQYAMVWDDDLTSERILRRSFRSRSLLSQSVPVGTGRLTSMGLLHRDANLRQVGLDEHFLVEDDAVWNSSCRQVDPDTGLLGPTSMPPRLAALTQEARRAGYHLLGEESTWRPTTSTTAYSVMSTSAGHHTWVVLVKRSSRMDRPHELVVIDAFGRERRMELDSFERKNQDLPQGCMERPGGGRWLVTPTYLRPLDEAEGQEAGARRDSEPGASHAPEPLRLRHLPCLPETWDDRGRVHVLESLPLVGFHQLQQRCPAASARMRTVTADDVTEVLAVCPVADDDLPHPASSAGVRPPGARARAAVEELLGPAPYELVTSVVWLAAQVKRLVAKAQAASARLHGTAGPEAERAEDAQDVAGEPLDG